MTEQSARPRFGQHKEDAEMLRNRDLRPGEPELSGDRWWPHETWKYADLHEEGAYLTSYERWLAERELERRKHRATMPSIVRRESLSFEPTRAPGVFVAYIVAPHVDQEAPSHIVEMLHLRPGARTIPVRENESVMHVLSGRGYSEIYGDRHDWEVHDSVHVPEGAWYQHVNDGTEPVNLIIGRVTPLMEQIYTMATVFKGDSFSDLPDDYQPEHPFTQKRVDVDYVEGVKWMSHMQLSHHKERDSHEDENRTTRKVMRAADAVIERSHHKGDWKVGLIDTYMGFSNKILGLYVHQLPPDCHTETHKHGWATIYVLTGHGYSIVDGDRHEWRAGDMINVPAGAWHQHFNTDPKTVSQHLLITPQPLRYRIHVTSGSVEERAADLSSTPSGDYVVKGDWWNQGS
jgi:quercetin dioxygenase-like cupin family protein